VFKLKEKFLDNLDRIVKVFIGPEKVFHELLENKKAITGIYFYIFFAAFLGFMTGALFGSIVMGVIVAILFIIAGLIKLVIWSGISHIIAKIVFKGNGKYIPLIGLFGYISVAFILGIVALALIIAGSVFSALLLLILMVIWAFIIAIVAVDAVHDIGVGRSFLSVFALPALIIIVIFAIMGVL
jgi:hypothetical protein